MFGDEGKVILVSFKHVHATKCLDMRAYILNRVKELYFLIWRIRSLYVESYDLSLQLGPDFIWLAVEFVQHCPSFTELLYFVELVFSKIWNLVLE